MSCDKGGDRELAPDPAARGPLSFQVKLASDPRLLSVVRSAVSELAAVSGFEDEQCQRIMMAVDEALSNVIRHAYKNRCDREIEVSCQAYADRLEFTFVDGGEPADLSRICGQPLNEIAFSGRGTHLIRQIMDEVCYERVSGRNRLALKKYLPGAGRKTEAGGKRED